MATQKTTVWGSLAQLIITIGAGYLGNKVVCHTLPVRPGRNLAVIVESAAVNHRQKMMGYNAAKELYRRVQENLMRGGEDDDE